jgi:hypothetical protein
LPEYLRRAKSFSDQNADVIVALDLEHVLDPTTIENRLKLGGFLDEANISSVAKTLAQIEGVMLGITVKDKITGSLRVDFKDNCTALKPHAKQLLIEVLSRKGAMIDDINNWNLSMSANYFTLSGPLSEGGLRQVFSLFRHSIEHDLFFQSPGAEPADAEISVATRSKQYLGKIESVLNELKSKPEGKALNTYASYFEQYANDVDNLSILNVDEDLAKFGTFVSDNLRNCAGVMRDAQFTKSNEQAQNSMRWGNYGVGGYYYGWGYNWNYGSQKRAIGTVQNNAGEKEARDIMRNLAEQLAKVRAELTKKYQIDF